MTTNLFAPRVEYFSGFIATLAKARRQFECCECPGVIAKGEEYYSVVVGGGGLQALKFPDRVHIFCLDKHKGRR